MTLTRNREHIARDLKPVSVQFQLTPNREVKVSVKYAPNRWEIEVVEKTTRAKERNVVSRTIVCHEAVEVSQVLKELLAEGTVKSVGLDVYGTNRPLQYLSAAALDTVAEHVAE